MSMPSLQQQLTYIESTTTALVHLADSIDIAEKRIHNLMQVLETRLFQEYLTELRLLQEDYQRGSKETMDFIESYPITYLEKQVGFIGEKLQKSVSQVTDKFQHVSDMANQ